MQAILKLGDVSVLVNAADVSLDALAKLVDTGIVCAFDEERREIVFGGEPDGVRPQMFLVPAGEYRSRVFDPAAEGERAVREELEVDRCETCGAEAADLRGHRTVPCPNAGVEIPDGEPCPICRMPTEHVSIRCPESSEAPPAPSRS